MNINHQKNVVKYTKLKNKKKRKKMKNSLFFVFFQIRFSFGKAAIIAVEKR